MSKINMTVATTLADHFEGFILACVGKGLSEKTILTYQQQFRSIAPYIDTGKEIGALTKADLDSAIEQMRKKGLATNTIASYVRTIKTFVSWCRQEGLTDLVIPLYKTEETIKETYTDEELKRLLKKPNTKKCGFNEYRNWAIVNLLVNSGCRAASIRNIQNRDVDLSTKAITLRHTKAKKVQVIPLCSVMANILREYMRVRQGEPTDYLFCTDEGRQLTEYNLSDAISAYNRSRGVSKTSIHLYRHTFARKYLVDCGGNAFTLQKLLGHKTLDMTRHYCNIFDADITRNYDTFSPLAQLSKGTEKIRMR